MLHVVTVQEEEWCTQERCTQVGVQGPGSPPTCTPWVVHPHTRSRRTPSTSAPGTSPCGKSSLGSEVSCSLGREAWWLPGPGFCREEGEVLVREESGVRDGK